MKLKRVSVGLAMCLVLASAGYALAADPVPPPDEEKRVGLASALAEYGKETRDALALVTAAKLYRGLSARVLRKGESGKAGQSVDADELLQTARALAAENQDLLKVIEEVERGDTGGKGIFIPSCYYEWYCSNMGCHYKWICF